MFEDGVKLRLLSFLFVSLGDTPHNIKCCPSNRQWVSKPPFKSGYLSGPFDSSCCLCVILTYRNNDVAFSVRPDNDAATTHGFHFSLVYHGCVQNLNWIRLLPKHSHNMADRTFAMYKEQVVPGKGGKTTSGCGAPWDAEDHVKRAMKARVSPHLTRTHLLHAPPPHAL